MASCLVALLAGCKAVPENFEKQPSFALSNTESTYLGETFGSQLKDHGDQSGVLLLGDGLDAFVGRALLAEKAERSIDVQYYMFHQDTVGQLLIHSLIKAADRGVRVRLLIDDMARSLGAGTTSLAWAQVQVIHDSSEKKERGEGWQKELLISRLWP